jgi:hypothetical protein
MDFKVKINAMAYDEAMHEYFIDESLEYYVHHYEQFDRNNGLKYLSAFAKLDDHYIFEVIDEKKYLLGKLKYGY